MTTSETSGDTPQHRSLTAGGPALLFANRVADTAFVNSRLSRLKWAVTALVEETADEILGLPNREDRPDLHAQVVTDPNVRRLRQVAALYFASTVPAGVVEAFVGEARRAGASWTDVGEATDVARQTARVKWAHLDVSVGPPVRMPRLRDLLAERAPEGQATT